MPSFYISSWLSTYQYSASEYEYIYKRRPITLNNYIPVLITVNRYSTPNKPLKSTANLHNLITVTPNSEKLSEIVQCAGGLKFCTLNARSLNNKAAEFVDYVCDRKPDLVAITETWFTDDESASRVLCTPEGYKLLDCPRLGRLGGGTGVLFRNSIITTKVAAAELQSFEYSEWSIRAGTQRLKLIIYRPPYSVNHPVSTAVFFTEFSSFIESAVLCTDRLLISDDFNIYANIYDDADAAKLQDLLESVGLVQHVRCPTHIGGHTLDLIITRQSDKLIETTPIADHLFSDHSPVLCQLQVGRPSWKKSLVSHRNTKSINLDALREDLSNSNLNKNMLSMDLNQLAISYDNTLSSVLENYAPLITRTITIRDLLFHGLMMT